MDKGRLDKIVSDFCLISGMELSILNANFHSVVISSAKDGFCSRIHRYQGTSEICKASDIERLSRVRESAAPMLYVCPCGLTEAIVPIVRGDRIIAYMIATMGITEGEEERAKELTSAILPSIGSTELDDAVSSVKKITDGWKQQFERSCHPSSRRL